MLLIYPALGLHSLQVNESYLFFANVCGWMIFTGLLTDSDLFLLQTTCRYLALTNP